MNATESPYEMANLFPKHTGLPFVVWISVHARARHDVRVKVSTNAKAIPGNMATVGIRPGVRVLEGAMDSRSLKLLRDWVSLNRQTLISYWEGEIDTVEAMAALVKLEAL
jgi:hypothetical protein